MQKQSEHLFVFLLVRLIGASLVLQVVKQGLNGEVERVGYFYLQNADWTLLLDWVSLQFRNQLILGNRQVLDESIERVLKAPQFIQ